MQTHPKKSQNISPKMDLTQSLTKVMILSKLTSCIPLQSNSINLYNLYKIFSRFLEIIFNSAQIIHIFIHIDNLQEIADSSYLFGSILGISIKRFIFERNFDLIEKSRNKWLTLEDFNRPKNDHQLRVLRDNLSLCDRIFYGFAWMVGSTVVFYSVLPLILVLLGMQERTWVYDIWLPFDGFSSDFVYFPVYLLQGFYLIQTAIASVAIDAMFFTVMIQIGAQFEILGNKLQNLKRGVNLRSNFYDCIQHHKLILDWIKDIDRSFGTTVLVQFGTSVLVLCQTMLTLFLTQFGAAFIVLVLYMISMLNQIFLYCWFGNQVVVKSGDINGMALKNNWYDFPQDVKKNLVFFLRKTQNPVVLSVGTIFPISLSTFMAIVKSSWAYFSALSKVQRDSESK